MVEEEEEEAEEVEEDVVVTKAASGSLVEMGTIVSVIESRYLKFEKKRSRSRGLQVVQNNF